MNSVETADARLLVLSAPDALDASARGQSCIPDDAQALITPNTFVLLNMVDNLDDTSVASIDGVGWLKGLENVASTWRASVRTQAGMRDFMDGLTKELHVS